MHEMRRVSNSPSGIFPVAADLEFYARIRVGGVFLRGPNLRITRLTQKFHLLEHMLTPENFTVMASPVIMATQKLRTCRCPSKDLHNPSLTW